MNKPSVTTLPKAAKETGFPYAELLKAAKSGSLPTIRPEGRRSWLVDMGDVCAFIEGLKSGSIGGSESLPERPQVALNKESRTVVRWNGKRGDLDWQQRYTKTRQQVS